MDKTSSDNSASSINIRPSFNKHVSFLCVEYPGIIANVNKMLATLGGIKNIEKVYSDSTKRLDLRFRPDDPCCKPLLGDKSSCNTLLLRVSKYQRKKKNDSNGENSKEKEYMYRQHICGTVTSIYRFTTLCDYQYLSLKRNEATNEMQNMVSLLQVDESTLPNKEFFTASVPIFLPPATYGRLDKPCAYLYRKHQVVYRRKSGRAQGSWESRITTRKNRRHNCILVYYDAKTPTECLPRALEILSRSSDHAKRASERLKKIFEDRPVWSRNALQVRTGVAMHTLKVLLPVHAYYVATGPWARLWIRFGFNPKDDPSAKCYQLVDFRLRQGMITPDIPVKLKRGSFLPPVGEKKPVPAPETDFFQPQPNQPNNETESSERSLEAVYIYKPGVLPVYRNTFYQICDIKLPEVQKLLESKRSSSCTKEDGWLLPNTSAQIRNLITKDIYNTLSIMKCGVPHELPKELHIPIEGEKSTPKQKESGASEDVDELDPEPSEDLDESDPDEEDLDSSDSSEDDEDPLPDRSQEAILAEAFSMDLNYGIVNVEEFDDGEFFLENDDPLMEVSVTSEANSSKE